MATDNEDDDDDDDEDEDEDEDDGDYLCKYELRRQQQRQQQQRQQQLQWQRQQQQQQRRRQEQRQAVATTAAALAQTTKTNERLFFSTASLRERRSLLGAPRCAEAAIAVPCLRRASLSPPPRGRDRHCGPHAGAATAVPMQGPPLRSPAETASAALPHASRLVVLRIQTFALARIELQA